MVVVVVLSWAEAMVVEVPVGLSDVETRVDEWRLGDCDSNAKAEKAFVRWAV